MVTLWSMTGPILLVGNFDQGSLFGKRDGDDGADGFDDFAAFADNSAFELFRSVDF